MDIAAMARSDLLAYCQLMNANYLLPDHIVKIAKTLMAVERGEIKRLLISVPPRHGKSMLCSQYFPAWYLGRNPNKYVITATYGQELSDDFGRKVRDLLTAKLHRAVFKECKLRNDTTAASRMETTLTGSYYGVGVGGPITGRGGHLILIDDPIKNREDADSSAMQKTLIEWYRSVAYTRLMPGGVLVVIMTRWNEEDLIGMLKRDNAHEDWTELRLPALSDDGKPLWPEAYNHDDLMRIKATLHDDYAWDALYQQDPSPKDGVIFKAETMVTGFDADYPAYYTFIDPAISKKDHADETAICVMAPRFEDGKIDEVETISGKFDFHEQIQLMETVYQKYKSKIILMGVETVAYQHALHQELHSRGLPVCAVKADKDKVRRAMSVSHLFSQNRVRINTPKLRHQLLAFRGETEKNDLADAAISCLRLILENSALKYEQKDLRMDKLDFVSKQFWQNHEKMIEQSQGQTNRGPADMFGL